MNIEELSAKQIAWLIIKAHFLKSIFGSSNLLWSLNQAMNKARDMRFSKIFMIWLWQFTMVIVALMGFGIPFFFYDALFGSPKLNG